MKRRPECQAADRAPARARAPLSEFVPATPRESAVKALLEAHYRQLVDLRQLWADLGDRLVPER